MRPSVQRIEMILSTRMQGIGDWSNWGEDLLKSAVTGVAQGITGKVSGSGAAPSLAPSPAIQPKPAGMSTGAKVALGVGGVALAAVLFKAIGGRRK